ncbi:DUF6368 family protein [Kitasatospora sp. NPDC056446]|uniref:DUF6368 family protein n=1 Tax=Kitasatospora sp. NPDC056446 TaxID=3345819 RepID=UPI0036A8932B
MAGPTLVIDLAEPVAPAVLREFRALVVGLSCLFHEERPGAFHVNVPVERLGIADTGGERSTDEGLTAPAGATPRREDSQRSFSLYLIGAGAGDESTFEAEHEDQSEVEAVLGFRPVQAVNVSAGRNRQVDHVATALLTAAVLDVVGGVCRAELADGQRAVVSGLPGLLGLADDAWDTALITAEFLRAWAERPGFRLVK